MSRSDLLYGLHAVQAALRADRPVAELWVKAGRHDRRMQAVVHLARQRDIAIHDADRAGLEALVGDVRHQGLVARLDLAATGAQLADNFRALLAGLEEPPFLLVLDGVQDPHNLGACLRTANAAGVHAVIAPRDRAVGLTPAVRKVASGAAETTPFIRVTNLARTLRELKEAGIWLVGTAGEAGSSLYEADLKGPLALVLGAEGSGLRRLTAEQCDYLVCLPMAGTVESLNVSVAAGICLYEAVRQRSG